MSKLKRFDIVGKYADEEVVHEFRHDGKCYEADEVDKVIAELQADYKEACDRLQTANLIKDEQLTATRHHKYKRCLAMAEMCDARYGEEDARVNGHGASWDYTSKEMKFWERWRQRWLNLADKVKEDKCR